MTEKRANEILRTKYPEATIHKRNSMGGTKTTCLAVTFKDGGKVYDYQGLSYQQVLVKLGFEILYKHNVESMKSRIEHLQNEIKAGGYEPILDLFHRDYVEYTEEEIKDMQNEIDKLNALINSAIIC